MIGFHWDTGTSAVMWRNNTGKRLVLDKTRTRVLEEGHKDGAFLLCGIDCEIPVQQAIDLGLFTPMDREAPVTVIEEVPAAELGTIETVETPDLEEKAYTGPPEIKAFTDKEIKGSGKRRR